MKNSVITISRIYSRRLNSTIATKPVLNATSLSANLYQNPSKWKNLEHEQLLELHKERKAKLGGLYKPSVEEFEALLPTAKHLGISVAEFNKYYYATSEQLEKELGIESRGDDDIGLEPYQFDELPSQAQLLVHQHREQRFYNRLAAYELPLLAQHRQEYRNPSIKTHPITYRYTTYLGEEHPNSAKVVLTVKTKDLGLNEKQLHKLRILARSRYDPSTDIFKMSSDRYPESAQNARYLNDILVKLIQESTNLTEDFSDIPLDTRHISARKLRKKKNNCKFPDEWKRPQDAPVKTIDLIEMIQNKL